MALRRRSDAGKLSEPCEVATARNPLIRLDQPLIRLYFTEL